MIVWKLLPADAYYNAFHFANSDVATEYRLIAVRAPQEAGGGESADGLNIPVRVEQQDRKLYLGIQVWRMDRPSPYVVQDRHLSSPKTATCPPLFHPIDPIHLPSQDSRFPSQDWYSATIVDWTWEIRQLDGALTSKARSLPPLLIIDISVTVHLST